jgi:hypothetical protein
MKDKNQYPNFYINVEQDRPFENKRDGGDQN